MLEAIFATSLMATALVGLAQMLAIAMHNNRNARISSFATILAAQKMEQLRGLTWGFDNNGLPLTDRLSDSAQPIDAPTGGTGLSLSPPGTLTHDTNGYVDYVDQDGNVLGGGAGIRPGTMYIRRWSIEPMQDNPNDTIAIQVLVTHLPDRGLADQDGSTRRLPSEARIMSIKTRKPQ